MNLWLVPVDEPSFQRTLAEPIDLSDWNNRPDSFPRTRPGMGRQPIRNRVPGSETVEISNEWARRPAPDLPEPESRYTATGRVGPMAHTEHVRDEYWDGGPALDITVIGGLRRAPSMWNQRQSTGCSTTKSHSGHKDSGGGDDRPTERVGRKFDMWCRQALSYYAVRPGTVTKLASLISKL